jgi:hypothetical protein
LDQLRTQSQQLEKEVDQATEEERRLREEKDEALRRIEAAQSALDSLGQAAR